MVWVVWSMLNFGLASVSTNSRRDSKSVRPSEKSGGGSAPLEQTSPHRGPPRDVARKRHGDQDGSRAGAGSASDRSVPIRGTGIETRHRLRINHDRLAPHVSAAKIRGRTQADIFDCQIMNLQIVRGRGWHCCTFDRRRRARQRQGSLSAGDGNRPVFREDLRRYVESNGEHLEAQLVKLAIEPGAHGVVTGSTDQSTPELRVPAVPIGS